MKMFSSWLVYWEGALIAYFFGLWWAAAWCVAWFILAAGIRVGRKSARQACRLSEESP